MRGDVIPGLIDGWTLHAGIDQRPGNISRDTKHVGVVTIGRTFVDEGGVRLPTAVRLLLADQPVARALDQPGVYVRHLRHVVELHQAVGGENLVGRRLAEPGEAASRNFEGEQTLVPIGDIAFGLGVRLRRELLGVLHVVERKHVWVGAGGSLLEAAAGHAEDAVHAFDELAKRSGVEADEDAGGIRNGVVRKVEIVCGGAFEPPVEDQILLATVGDDLDLADDDVIARGRALHVGGEGELEFADARGGERELRSTHAARFSSDGFFRRVVIEREPVFPLELEADLAGLAGVVVNRDGERDLVALSERDGKIEIDEEVLKDLQARGGSAECAGGGGGEHGHAPRGDGVGNRDRDVSVALGVGDDLGIDVERFREVGADVRRGLLRDCLKRDSEATSLHGLGDRFSPFHLRASERGHGT